MKNYESRSTVKPPEWDRTSCPDLIYHHTNIVPVIIDNDGEDLTMYSYTVTEYTKSEYLNYVAEQTNAQLAQIHEIADLTDINLEEPNQGISLKERINDLEIAICELLDSLA